jgi:hypothetical protein
MEQSSKCIKRKTYAVLADEAIRIAQAHETFGGNPFLLNDCSRLEQ